MNIISRYTLKTLQKNKIRTVVTIIGIILSVAMFTAVTVSVSSAQAYIGDLAIHNAGNFHGYFKDLSQSDAEKLKDDEEIDQVVTRQSIGYALFGSQNEDKPYLFIGGIQEGFDKLVSVTPIEGRLPENNRELLIPQHIASTGGVKFNVGDQITLEVGTLIDNNPESVDYGQTILQGGNFHDCELTGTRTVTYTIVGIYARPDYLIEDSRSGYTALTLEDPAGSDHYTTYFTLKKMGDVFKWQEAHHYDDSKVRFNTDLLSANFISNNESQNAMIVGFMSILMGLIMFGSISLIYNSFSISVSERTKQFGLLKSIGATKKQILRSVLFEALLLCVIGIPLGLLSGCVGIGVTFRALRGTISSFLNSGPTSIYLSLHVEAWALIVSALISIVTVLISAYIPARRAVRLNTIDAIRQTKDVSLSSKQVKTSKLTYKLFGFPGTLASKNFKRSKKKYRSTVVSLSLSVLLFISASSFSGYLTGSVDNINTTQPYDLFYYSYSSDFDTLYERVPATSQKLSAASNVTGSYYYIGDISTESAEIDRTLLTDAATGSAYQDYFSDDASSSTASLAYVRLLFVDNASFAKLLKQAGLDSDRYMNSDRPIALFNDAAAHYDGYKTQKFNLFTDDASDFTLTLHMLEDESTERKEAITVAACIREDPLFGASAPTIYLPMSAAKELAGGGTNGYDAIIYLNSDNHGESYTEMCEILQAEGLPTAQLYDYADSVETQRAIVTVINVFSYGFIALISLIALANVFNTISTNLQLRRREFAMLKSIGMTEREFSRMLNFECILYGVKGLAFGLSGSVIVSYLLYKVAIHSGDIAFTLPWLSILIAIGSVFAVVFATMIYQKQRMKKENLIDTLKKEIT